VLPAFRFGRFELHVAARELRKDGVRLRLQDQPFEVLSMMVERPGEVLTRDELRQRLWPDGTFVDFEHSLNAAVKRVRSALGDNANNPRFVETLHRRGYRFIGSVESIQQSGSVAAIGQAAGSRLAVLPFTNLGEPTEPGYFTDGLTEEMITQLGRLFAGRLGIIARTSSMLVQRDAPTLRQIGEALRVQFIVEGRVRREGERVRITVQLIETQGETQLWAESYERHLSDCFLVQSEVATEIAQSLAMELLPGERRGAGSRHVGAHQAYLKGRYHWNRSGGDGLLEAISYFEESVALDPSFAAAHSTLARAHLAAADYYLEEPRAACEAGEAAAARALALDPADSQAHLTLAEVKKNMEWDWTGAERGYKAALAFNPSDEAVHRCFGLYLAGRRRPAEAAAAATRAWELDPLCLVVNTSAAWVQYAARNYDRAMAWCRHTLDMDAAFVPARRLLAAALLQVGKVDEALGELDRVPADRRDPVTESWRAHALAVKGDRRAASTVIDQLDQLALGRYVTAYHRAVAHAGVNDIEGAFALLARACEDRDPALINVAVEPRFDRLRSHPRYGTLAARLGLDQGARSLHEGTP
jgi:TolB-like protein/Tfp pilus assembly protein PilF